MLFFPACNKEDEKAVFSGHLSIELRKFFENGQKNTALHVVSIEEYPCSNFQIKYETSQSGSSQVISFEGIRLYDACVTSVGPAMAFIEIGQALPGTHHDLVFIVNDESVSTSLIGEQDKVFLDLVKGDNPFIEIRNEQVKRVPGNFVWGYIHGKAGITDIDSSIFYDSLWDAGVVKKNLPPGNYGFFRIGDEKLELFDQGHSNFHENYFLGEFEDDFDTLEDIAREFSEDYVIAIFSGAGEIFHNQ